jgi:hypothetical protein
MYPEKYHSKVFYVNTTCKVEICIETKSDLAVHPRMNTFATIKRNVLTASTT